MIQRCIVGDSFYQKKLYKTYIQAMYNRCVRMCSDTEVAKDVVQESFIDVFANLSQFRGQSTLGAWIKTIVIRKAVAAIKKNQKMEMFPLEGLEFIEDSNENTIELDANKIHGAIKKLPLGARNVLTLHLLEGYKHHEIASILEISESTSKSQYQRAKRLLKLELKEIKEYG